MAAARRRGKKIPFQFKATHIIAALTVFVVSVGIGSATLGTTSRMSQFALVKEADMKCTPEKDYSYPCGKQNPKTKKIGGKECPCNDETNGHTTPGKCQGPEICKGEPPGGGDGKMPELPKMEPPKDDKSPPPPPTDTKPCSAQGLSGNQSDFNARDDLGNPCPNTTLGGTILDNLGGGIPTTTDATTSPTSTPHTFSWFAVGRVVQDITNAASNAVGNIFGNSNAASSSGSARPIRYPNPDAVALQAGNTGGNGNLGGEGGGTQAPFYTSPELNTFGQPVQGGSANPQPTGFWNGLTQALKNFLNIF